MDTRIANGLEYMAAGRANVAWQAPVDAPGPGSRGREGWLLRRWPRSYGELTPRERFEIVGWDEV